MPVSSQERQVRHLLCSFLPDEEIKFNWRPEWLLNRATGWPLELDMYVPRLKLGIEYNGLQHLTQATQYERDKLKARLCHRHGVYLHVVQAQDLRHGLVDLLLGWIAAASEGKPCKLLAVPPFLGLRRRRVRYQVPHLKERARGSPPHELTPYERAFLATHPRPIKRCLGTKRLKQPQFHVTRNGKLIDLFGQGLEASHVGEIKAPIVALGSHHETLSVSGSPKGAPPRAEAEIARQ